MTETYWCPGPWPWEWFRTCTREVPDDPCKAPACVAAKAKLTDARNRFTSSCNGLRMLNAVTKLLTQILSTPIWIVVALALIAVIIGGPIAVVIWALIAVYGLSWLLLPVVGKMSASIAVSLNQARLDFQNALPDVISQCPVPCRGDLSIPECRLD